MLNLVLAVSLVVPSRAQTETAPTCFTSGDIAGSVLGTFFSTLAAVAIAFIIYWFVCRRKRDKPRRGPSLDVEAHAYDNPYFQEDEPDKVPPNDIKAENGSANSGKALTDKNKLANDAKLGKKSKSNKNNPFSNVFSNNKSHAIQRALDDSCIQQEPEKIEVRLRGCDFTGLGFNICGNIRHGIYVRDVLHRGPASESGKIKAGDRILGVTVCFDKITIEDALTILSYASPYDVTLYMQKTSDHPGGFLPGHQKKGSTSSSVSGTGGGGGGGEPLSHPVYRSQSSDDVSQLTRENVNNKRSMSVGVVPPRIKKESLSRLSPSCRVESISEGGDVQIHNESNKRETVVTVVVNESPESKKSEGTKSNKEDSSGTNPFIIGTGSKQESQSDRRNSTQTSNAFVVPRNLTVEIPTFGLTEASKSDSKVSGENGGVLGQPIEPVSVLGDSNGNSFEMDKGAIGVPDMKRTFIRELTNQKDDSFTGFDVPAMDLDDVQVSLDATLQKGKEIEAEINGVQEKIDESMNKSVPDVTAIKQTIIDKLKHEVTLVTSPDEVKVNSENVQRLGNEQVILPRVDIKTPSAADFEASSDSTYRNRPLTATTANMDPTLDDNINYFESKMQTVLQKSPNVKPKRNSIAGKRRAPLPPTSPDQEELSKPGNPFVVGIPSQASVVESQATSIVFLKPNNVTSVQVNDSPEPKSPRRIRAEGVDFRKTNFHEGLDKADGDEKFNSIPRNNIAIQEKKTMSNDKGTSSRRAASLDDLTKIEDAKPLPLERAVSMDLNNVEDPPVDQLGEIEAEMDKDSSDERLLLKYNADGGRGYKKSWENLSQTQKENQMQDLEQWIDENIDKNSLQKSEGFFKKDKGVKRKKKTDELSTTELPDSDVTYVARPLNLDRTLSLSSSSLSEDSIELNIHQPAAKRQMVSVDATVKTYASDSDSDEEKPRTLSPTSKLTEVTTRRSPTVTIPIIPPIINTRDLRTPSPSKDHHGGIVDIEHFRTTFSSSKQLRPQKENGQHNGDNLHSFNNNDHDVAVTTTHTTPNENHEKNVEPYSVSCQGVVSKAVFISGPQLSMPVTDSLNNRPSPESPPPILQPPE